MKKLPMTPANEQIINQVFQLAAKGAQNVALEQLENMVQTLNKSMEDAPNEPQTEPDAPAAVSENVEPQGASGAVHNN